MSLNKKLADIHHSLAFRLTLWYAGIFLLIAIVAFVLFYLLITTVLRQQTDQDLISEVRAFSSIMTVQGTKGVKQQALLESQAAGEKKIFFRLLYITGQVFSSSNMSYWRDIGINRATINELLRDQRPVFDTVSIANRRHQVRILYAIIGPGVILQLGRSMENHTRIIEAFRKIFVATTALLLVVAVGVGWFMAKRALSGVARIAGTARRISGGSLDERVPVKKQHDEIDQLALTFNQMLDRIQRLVSEIKEMSDNIAHDLKSPITRMRGTAEVTLTTGQGLAEYKNMAASTIEECDRLLGMINTMLMISRTEAGLGQLERNRMDLAVVVRDACELFSALAEDKKVRLACHCPRPVFICGDIRMIQRMIANLLDNAVKYTPAGGKIEVTLDDDPGRPVRLMVKDTGIGIAAEDQPRVFDRFYRCDPSRSQAGTGLGLSLARAVARAHQGEVTLESQPHRGSTFTVSFPLPTDTESIATI